MDWIGIGLMWERRVVGLHFINDAPSSSQKSAPGSSHTFREDWRAGTTWHPLKRPTETLVCHFQPCLSFPALQFVLPAAAMILMARQGAVDHPTVLLLFAIHLPPLKELKEPKSLSQHVFISCNNNTKQVANPALSSASLCPDSMSPITLSVITCGSTMRSYGSKK